MPSSAAGVSEHYTVHGPKPGAAARARGIRLRFSPIIDFAT